jgi:hypothetical protein
MFNFKNFFKKENKEYKSKYYDISAYFESSAQKYGWQKEDFIWALKILESLSKKDLIKICNHPAVQIKFINSSWDKVDEEEIIGAIISDIKPDLLLSILKNNQ